jgi:hypothetical protein
MGFRIGEREPSRHLLHRSLALEHLLSAQQSRAGTGAIRGSIDTGGRIANALVQEFILQKYTTNAKNKP